MNRREGGYTLVELMLGIVVLSIICLSTFTLFTSLLNSALLAKRQAVAYTLATNQMEYLKSLPYDSLAIAGGAIVANQTMPASFTKKVNGFNYTVRTAINYSDDAFDGCGSYPTQALKQLYCRNYPPPSGAPTTDTNPADTKSVSVAVYDKSNVRLSFLDTNVAARVAETASNTGAMFVKIIDGSGNPIVGATVNVRNTTTSPVVNVSDGTDENGTAIFYGLPPDSTNSDYNISGSYANYSSLTTIVPNGSLQPTYSNQNLLTQNSAIVTLRLYPQGSNSLVVETTDLNGAPLSGVRPYVKGGYKRYTLASDTTYYYDNMRTTDARPTTDGTGQVAISNLVPGDYIFCGDVGATSCTIGTNTYYLAAAVPYGGGNTLNPITVPIFDAAHPPAQTFAYSSNNYLQKVRLMLTTDSAYPRVFKLTPSEGSLASGTLSNLNFTITGANLPCSSTAASCGTSVRFLQGSNTYTASCTGTSGNQLACRVNLSGAIASETQLQVAANGRILTLPASPLIGGFVVKP